ncbi:MAG: hypothetical protein ACYDDI_03585 [Candidatus Acidiferrales bacterium]
MSIKRLLRKILLCIVLGGGSVLQTQMSPEKIEEILHSMNQTRVEVVVPELDKENRTRSALRGVRRTG